MNWAKYKSNFYDWDGSFRDIYVFDTDISDWNKMLQIINSKSYELDFSLDGEKSPLPSDAKEIFEQRIKWSTLLSINVTNVIINCHFFCLEEMEFDIDPREITDEMKFQGLTNFMQDLSDGLGKPVVLTEENEPKSELLCIKPQF